MSLAGRIAYHHKVVKVDHFYVYDRFGYIHIYRARISDRTLQET